MKASATEAQKEPFAEPEMDILILLAARRLAVHRKHRFHPSNALAMSTGHSATDVEGALLRLRSRGWVEVRLKACPEGRITHEGLKTLSQPERRTP